MGSCDRGSNDWSGLNVTSCNPNSGLGCCVPKAATTCSSAGGTCESGCTSKGGVLVNGGAGCPNQQLTCCNLTPPGACSAAGGTCTNSCIASGGTLVNGGAGCGNQQLICCKFGGGGTPSTPTPTPTTAPPGGGGGGPTAQCLNIQAFDTNWVQLSGAQLAALRPGDKVRFTVAGQTSSGSFDRARFIINGTTRPEVTGKRPATQEFFDEYTIPDGISTFSINAQLHHSTLGWF